MNIFLGLLGIVALVSSCQESPKFVGYSDVNIEGWNYAAPVILEIPEDSVSQIVGTVRLGVRTTDMYNYKNLYLQVTVKDGDRNVWCDTVAVSLYDERGMDKGKGFPFKEYNVDSKALVVPAKCKYSIYITHLMAANPVKGVSQVGVKVE